MTTQQRFSKARLQDALRRQETEEQFAIAKLAWYHSDNSYRILSRRGKRPKCARWNKNSWHIRLKEWAFLVWDLIIYQ